MGGDRKGGGEGAERGATAMVVVEDPVTARYNKLVRLHNDAQALLRNVCFDEVSEITLEEWENRLAPIGETNLPLLSSDSSHRPVLFSR